MGFLYYTKDTYGTLAFPFFADVDLASKGASSSDASETFKQSLAASNFSSKRDLFEGGIGESGKGVAALGFLYQAKKNSDHSNDSIETHFFGLGVSLSLSAGSLCSSSTSEARYSTLFFTLCPCTLLTRFAGVCFIG